MTTTNATTPPRAIVWWSITHTAWGCQIGNDRSFHYNEADAIRHGERLAATVARRSLIVVEG